MSNRIVIPRPFDGHIHFREWLHFLLNQSSESAAERSEAFATFKALVTLIARTYDGAVAMANLLHGWVSTPDHAETYVKTLLALISECDRTSFRLLPTFRLTHETTVEMVAEYDALGVRRGKIYPDDPTKQSVTTHSSGGIYRFQDPALIAVFQEMARRKMCVLCHCELPGSHYGTAEQDFIPIVSEWLEAVPDLLFGFEHISSEAGVNFVVQAGNNVFATVTPQHLTQIETDWCEEYGGSAHNECKPSAKTTADREAIVEVAISGHPRFGFGSDAAAHHEARKQRGPGHKTMPGCFNVVAAIPTIFELFDVSDAFDQLAAFTSGNFCRWSGITPPTEEVAYVREPHIVPQYTIPHVVNWRAGETVQWWPDEGTV